MPDAIFGVIPGAGAPMSLIDYLDKSSFDELAEFDLVHGRHRNLYHIEGKYYVPLMDCSYRDMVSFALENMVHPEDRAVYRDMMDPETLEQRLARAQPEGVLQAQLRYKLLSGGWRWTSQVVAGGSVHGLPRGIVRVYVFDIQNQKDRQEGLQSSFSTERERDEITGLLRQKPFFQACEERLGRCGGWNLICVDIENFNLFNEWYGRDAGDILLARIGALLREAADGSGGLAGYLGQDDFCLFLPGDAAEVERLYRAIHDIILEKEISVGFLPAFGVAPAHGASSVLTLYDQAAVAMRSVKGNFQHRIRTYAPSMRKVKEEEYRLLSDFQRGLSNQEIFVSLQPQCRISTGRIVGAESLARWRKPDGTMMSPDQFVPVLEKYGFVTDLDKYIWEAVCRWLSDWIARGHTPLPISINVSQIDIFTIDVPEYIEGLVRKYHLPARLLKIEITESAYVSNTVRVRDTVQRLREKGFLILMDDFGSGYSSLNMLRKLHVDILKLDAQFLRLNDMDAEKGIHIIETIVNMAQTLSLPIIVEGVENEEQVNFLSDLGCRYIQGYHYYRPLEIAEFEKLIGDAENVDLAGFAFKANQQFRVREFMDENIYSDTMLNNILGAVAFYRWDRKDDIQIIRFNEQFYHLVREPALFNNRLEHIQSYFHPLDRQPFFAALKKAREDRLNGSTGLFGTYRADGSLVRLVIHFYFLEEDDSGMVFYGSVQDLTEYTSLQHQMQLLSRFVSESIVFAEKDGEDYRFHVVIHGLRDSMGVSAEDFQRELNEGAFPLRLAEDEQKRVRVLSTGELLRQAERFRAPYHILDANGRPALLFIQVDQVHDEYSKVEYILAFRLRGLDE